MASSLLHSESRRLYSWWWDSHISPKNSKWLQENLTDMDAKVKAMIKLIEEDADSFARRAEMYYKKRPELMKLVEEFYRAYRALAERYDHATGALRQAQRTMSEAFPNQLPFGLADDSPSGSSAGEAGPHTPEMPHPLRALLDPDDLQKDALGLSSSQFHAVKKNGAYSEESDLLSKKGLKQLNMLFGSEEGMPRHAKFAEGRVRKGLNFQDDDAKSSQSKAQNGSRSLSNHEVEDRERRFEVAATELSTENQNLKNQIMSESVRAGEAETKVQTLTEALAKLEAETEASLLQYSQSLERLANLEAEVSRAQEDSRELNDRASKAETDVETLKQCLARLEEEKEAGLLQYSQCLERISNLESKISRDEEDAVRLNERANEAETELQILKQSLAKLEAEKADGLLQYQQCLEKISHLETQISRAEEDAGGVNERACKAEAEAQILKEALARLESEKEAGIVQYNQCLEKISNLESNISHAEEDGRKQNERADKAETDVQSLKQVVARLESEKDAGLVQYNQCLEKISHLETQISRAEEDAGGFNERACKAEAEAQTLRQALAGLESERKAGLVQYKQCLETISNLETKIFHAEEDARRLGERAEKAETDVQSLKQVIATLHEEKETAALQYQHCLETISNLEAELVHAQEEAKNLNSEIVMGVAKLNSAEEQNLLLERANQSLQAEFDTLAQKTDMQRQELLEKHEELERLRLHIQKETMRSMKVEATLHTLEELHSLSLEDRRSLAMELQKGVLMLKDVEHWNQGLEDEVRQLKEENSSLNEQASSSDILIKSLHEEIFNLREVTGKLEEEVGLRLDQRNALQQEIYCLKEEISDLNRRHQGVIEQVESVGLKPDCLGSSVKDLQVENSKLKEVCQKYNDEKVVLLEKLENMEKLLEKNALLENSLSDVNAELEGFREKVKSFEGSCQSLQEEKSILVAEKITLVSQLEIVTEKMEKLSEKNTLVENSLSDANTELESLRTKSKSLEESYKSLEDEKSGLVSEKDSLVSHLQSIQLRLEELEKRYTDLEEKYSHLEKEKKLTIQQVEELRGSLDLEKQEHANFVQSSDTRLARLEDQILLVHEEGRWRKKEYEEEQDKAINAQVEIFILQRSIRDMEEKNFCLLIECQKHFEASQLSEKLICELEQEYLEQQVEVESLVNQLDELRTGIHQVLKSLEVDPDFECQNEIGEEKMLLQIILGKIEEIKSSSLITHDANQLLLLEKSVLVTLLEQHSLEAADLESERNMLDQKVKIRSGELMMLQSERQELLEMNIQLRVEVKAGEQREEVLKAEMENLRMALLDLQDAYLVLQHEKSEVHEENRSLVNKWSKLEEKNYLLEEENCLMLGEIMALDNFSLVSKSYGAEKAVELVGLSDDLDHLHGVNNDLKKEVLTFGEKLETAEMENMDLKRSVVKLENELNTVRNAGNQLNQQLQNEKDMLSQKEMELSEVEEKLKATQNKNLDLHTDLKNLKREYDEAWMMKDELEKQNVKQLEDYAYQSKEIRRLCEVNGKFESELTKLRKEIEDGKIREKTLNSELQTEVKLQETETARLYADHLISMTSVSLFEEKVNKLIGACESLQDENISKQTEIEQLKERITVLEGESGGLKSKLAAYLPVIVSLRENITSLQERALSQTMIHVVADNNKPKDEEFSGHLNDKSCDELSEDHSQLVEDGVSDLQELQTRVKSVEMALMEMEMLAKQDSLDVSIRLEAAMKELEDLKSKRKILHEEDVQTNKDTAMQLKEEKLGERKILHEEDVQTNKDTAMQLKEEKLGDDPSSLKLQKTEPEISEVGKGTLMKDIPLDQISECSSYDHGFGSHGVSRRENGDSDQMLELWETTERDSSFKLVNRTEKTGNAPTTSYNHQLNRVEQKSRNPSSDLQAEKELGVDKLELSKRITEPHQEAHKRKVLERLDSDAQKLTNLQITVQDLKKMVERPRKSRKAKGTEFDDVKIELQVIEENIMQLVDVNSKLSKNVEEGSLPSGDRISLEEIEESRKVRRRRVTEQVREGSERIGRLQLEVQRVQFHLLKIEDEHRTKVTSAAKRSPGILLRDYIYTGRSSSRRKKAPCCACMRPSTQEE